MGGVVIGVMRNDFGKVKTVGRGDNPFKGS
jgi:hypothetical protein